MDSNNQFFTQSVVGAPMTLYLGRRSSVHHAAGTGLEVSLRDGRTHLSPAWGEWLLVRHLEELSGAARGRPTRARRWIERHCLLIAGLGFAMMLGSVVLAFL